MVDLQLSENTSLCLEPQWVRIYIYIFIYMLQITFRDYDICASHKFPPSSCSLAAVWERRCLDLNEMCKRNGHEGEHVMSNCAIHLNTTNTADATIMCRYILPSWNACEYGQLHVWIAFVTTTKGHGEIPEPENITCVHSKWTDKRFIGTVCFLHVPLDSGNITCFSSELKRYKNAM